MATAEIRSHDEHPLPCISVVITCKLLSLNYGAGSPCLKSREAREDNDRRLCCSKTGQHCTDLDRSHVRSIRSSGSTAKLMKGQGVGTQLDRKRVTNTPVHEDLSVLR